jgi:hypothetical protein
VCLFELLSQKETDPDSLNMLYVVKHKTIVDLNPNNKETENDTMDSANQPNEYVFSLHVLEVFYNDRFVKMLVLRD